MAGESLNLLRNEKAKIEVKAEAEKGRVYLANAFSLSMLDLNRENHNLKIREINQQEFCKILNSSNIINAVGHQGTIDLINQLCGVNFSINRINIKLENGDIIIVIQVLERLPEGKILGKSEIEKLLNEGKIKFLRVQYSN